MTSLPEETPEEHVQQSVGRQKKSAAKLAKEAEEKASVLAKATDLLSSRVGTLADAVQTNNYKIDRLQEEINHKPDDTELKFVEDQGRRERRRQFKYALVSMLVTAFLAAYVAYDVSNRQGKERCMVNAKNINTIVSILERPELRTRFEDEISDLRSNRNACE